MFCYFIELLLLILLSFTIVHIINSYSKIGNDNFSN